MEYLVGTGGWAYFKVPGKQSLEAYSQVFNFVEINTTFYEYPDSRTVENWRRRVPRDFTFAVRCHQDLTHKIGLKPVDESYSVFARMTEYCGILEAPFLVLETPRSYVLNNETVGEAKDFFSSAKLRDVQLVWDVRAPVTVEVAGFMQDFGIVQSVDLSREQPVETSDVVYSRLFGKGWHTRYQFTDDELLEIDAKLQKAQPRIATLAYHGMRMNTDAARFKIYKETGKFIPVTQFNGVESAKSVLSEDAKFPASKADLIRQQGWKVVDLTSQKRVHLSDLLCKIPEREYSHLEEVVAALEAVI